MSGHPMSKIEEVARAIEEKLSELTSGDYTLDYPVNDQGTAAELAARAALLALREPDEGMVRAGSEKSNFGAFGAEGMWQAMIDHALTQETSE